MEVKSLLMVMATLTIAGCSQNEMTEMNPDTNRTIGLDVYTEVQDQRNGNYNVHIESKCRFRYFCLSDKQCGME